MQATTILVTGSGGFLGRHLVPLLAAGGASLVLPRQCEYDLLRESEWARLFEACRPDVLIHLAALSGGIGVNRAKPADFLHVNTLLTTHGFHFAAAYGVKKMIYTMGGCSYPATSTSPIDEGQMWNGYPQQDSAGYSMAKKMGIVAAKSYRTQHGLNCAVLIPGNMYGEYDNFRTAESHVVPAMIRRYHEATLSAAPEVVMWGSGRPTRDFVYAGDVAACIPWFIDHYDSDEPVNLSSSTSTSIRELAEIIRDEVGYRGRINWDASKPDGQMEKIFASGRMRSLGLTCPTTLREGIRRTAVWLRDNYQARGDGIRL